MIEMGTQAVRLPLASKKNWFLTLMWCRLSVGGGFTWSCCGDCREGNSKDDVISQGFIFGQFTCTPMLALFYSMISELSGTQFEQIYLLI